MFKLYMVLTYTFLKPCISKIYNAFSLCIRVCVYIYMIWKLIGFRLFGFYIQ